MYEIDSIWDNEQLSFSPFFSRYSVLKYPEHPKNPGYPDRRGIQNTSQQNESAEEISVKK
jgi:hypothetical protein